MDPAHPASTQSTRRVKRTSRPAVPDPAEPDSRSGPARRGRIAHTTYQRLIGKGLTQDWYTLDRCEALTRLELVDELVRTYPKRYITRGAAVRAILDKATDQVIAACRQSADHGSERIATFLESRSQGVSVSEIARDWGLSREYVSRRVGRQAIGLVTDRVLAIGRHPLVLQQAYEPVPSPSVKQPA